MPSGVGFEGYFSCLLMTFVASQSLCAKSEKWCSWLQPVTDSQTQFRSVPTHLYPLLYFNLFLAEGVYRDMVSYFLCGASDSSEQELPHSDTLFLSGSNVMLLMCLASEIPQHAQVKIKVVNCQFTTELMLDFVQYTPLVWLIKGLCCFCAGCPSALWSTAPLFP